MDDSLCKHNMTWQTPLPDAVLAIRTVHPPVDV